MLELFETAPMAVHDWRQFVRPSIGACEPTRGPVGQDGQASSGCYIPMVVAYRRSFPHCWIFPSSMLVKIKLLRNGADHFPSILGPPWKHFQVGRKDLDEFQRSKFPYSHLP